MEIIGGFFCIARIPIVSASPYPSTIDKMIILCYHEKRTLKFQPSLHQEPTMAKIGLFRILSAAFYTRLGMTLRSLLRRHWPELCAKEVSRERFIRLQGAHEALKSDNQSLVQSLAFRREEMQRVELNYVIRLQAKHQENELLKKQAEELLKKQEELLEEAGKDDLTGLLRRPAMERAFRQYVSTVRRTVNSAVLSKEDQEVGRVERSESLPETSILFIDANKFKSINDTLGHTVGDQVLVAIARVIKGALLRETDIAARYGGDEFLVILGNTSLGLASAMALRIAKAIEEIELGIEGLAISVSIGVALVHLDYHDPKEDPPGPALEDARQRADMAMYMAKNIGHRVVTAPDIVQRQ